VFGLWDVAAIHVGWWHYDARYLIGVTLPGRLPLEELLFFLVIPTCAVLTLEAVRARKPHWVIGDESPHRIAAPARRDAAGDPGA
jgi:hypothetical protein